MLNNISYILYNKIRLQTKEFSSLLHDRFSKLILLYYTQCVLITKNKITYMRISCEKIIIIR